MAGARSAGDTRGPSPSRSSTSVSTTSTDLIAGAALVAVVRAGEPLAEPAVDAVNRVLRRLERVANRPERLRRTDGRSAPGGSPDSDDRTDQLEESRIRSEPGIESDGRRGRGLPASFFEPEAARAVGRHRPPPHPGIYVLLPKLVGVQNAIAKLGDAKPVWVAVAVAFAVVMFAAYVALFRGVVGERVLHAALARAPTRSPWPGWRRPGCSRRAAPAASSSPTGRCARRGCRARQTAGRMVAFLVLLYIGLHAGAGGLRRPAAHRRALAARIPVGADDRAGGDRRPVIVVFLLDRADPATTSSVAWRGAPRGTGSRRWRAAPGERPGDRRRRHPDGDRWSCAIPPAAGSRSRARSASGRPTSAILWASFHAFGVYVPLGVVVQGFFVGMVANLFPFAPGGVGAVDAGHDRRLRPLRRASSTVFAAVLTYRVIAFWLPIPPGIVAFLQLRRRSPAGRRRGRAAGHEDRRSPAGRRVAPLLHKVK